MPSRGDEGGAAESEPFMSYDFSDAYAHPGSPLMVEGPYGRLVLRRHGTDGMLWCGEGSSPDGARPFVDVRGYTDGAKRARLWRGAVGCYDDPEAVLLPEAARRAAPREMAAGAELVLLTRRQTQTQPPQLLLRAVSPASAAAADAGAEGDSSTVVSTLSDPEQPQPSLQGIGKALIKYQRADGVQLSGTLFTPAGYDAARDGP